MWGIPNDGSTYVFYVPPLPSGMVYTAVAAGGIHSLALRIDGQAVGWGNNGDGQTVVPALPAGLTYTAVAGGSNHSLALRSDGQVVGWGYNGFGQTNVPDLPSGLSYTAVAGGNNHSLALRSDGQVVAWGINSSGQTNVPAPPSGAKYTAVSGGGNHSLALTGSLPRQDQTLSFTTPAPTDARVGGSATVSATSTSGLAVTTGSSTPGVCTLSEGTISFVAVGTCTLAASQTGNDSFNPAPAVTQSFPVSAPADTTAPTITPSITGTLKNGWYTGDVTVSWAVTDDESEVSARTGCDPTTLDRDTAAVTLTCEATSAGGTDSASVTLKRDATAPSLAPVVTPNPVLVSGSATATPNAGDATSGVASQSCGAVDTNSVGGKSVTCTATDHAGNTATARVSYGVVYGFDGFFSPVSNTALNLVKAGQPIPLKWRLTDASGAPVTGLSTVQTRVTSLNCSSGSASGTTEEAVGGSGLQNLGDGYYQFNWKTPKSYAGLCKAIRLDLNEGVTHTARFSFKK